MKETDIRPDALLVDQKVVMLQDVGRLLTRRDGFVECACPACQGQERAARWEKYGLSYWECRACGTVYISPRPSPEVLEWFYRGSLNYAYWHRHIFPASEAARRQRIFVPRVNRFLELCQKHGTATRSLLEVGAAYGTFCAELQSRGVFQRIVAVEPTPDLARHIRGQGLEVIETPFETAEFPAGTAFDAVAAFEVIEHLFCPEDFIRQAAALLAPGGLLLVTCPNVRGFDIATLGRASDSVDVEHLNYFHPASLAGLVQRCRLEVLEVQTPGLLDAELVRKKVLSGEFSLADSPWLQRLLGEDWERHGAAFQSFLAQQGLSSHLWICARKPASGTGTC